MFTHAVVMAILAAGAAAAPEMMNLADRSYGSTPQCVQNKCYQNLAKSSQAAKSQCSSYFRATATPCAITSTTTKTVTQTQPVVSVTVGTTCTVVNGVTSTITTTGTVTKTAVVATATVTVTSSGNGYGNGNGNGYGNGNGNGYGNGNGNGNGYGSGNGGYGGSGSGGFHLPFGLVKKDGYYCPSVFHPTSLPHGICTECTASGQFSSACSCLGVKPSTTTLPAATSTVTVTQTVTAKPQTTLVTRPVATVTKNSAVATNVVGVTKTVTKSQTATVTKISAPTNTCAALKSITGDVSGWLGIAEKLGLDLLGAAPSYLFYTAIQDAERAGLTASYGSCPLGVQNAGTYLYAEAADSFLYKGLDIIKTTTDITKASNLLWNLDRSSGSVGCTSTRGGGSKSKLLWCSGLNFSFKSSLCVVDEALFEVNFLLQTFCKAIDFTAIFNDCSGSYV